MAQYHISFATVNQKEMRDGSALIMVTTHFTNEASILSACKDIKDATEVLEDPVSIRIFDTATH